MWYRAPVPAPEESGCWIRKAEAIAVWGISSSVSNYQDYVSTHYKRAHKGDFKTLTSGYGAVYDQCLPPHRHARILDLGCGLGEFLGYLVSNGYQNCEGLEVGGEQVAAARERVLVPVHHVAESEVIGFLTARAGQFDMVVMNYVIEHLPKNVIVELLRAVGEALKPGGCIVVTTDNPAPLSGLLSRYNDFTHETIFTELSLQQVLELAAFRDVELVIPKRPPAKTLRSYAGRLAHRCWVSLLKLIYFIEKPGDYRPTNFESPLAARGRKA